MSEKPKKDTAFNWVLVLGYATIVAYAVGYFWFISPSRIGTFLSGDTRLNEIGDFLAGSFAFPAFVLLGMAVIMQRQELKETKKQFADASGVTAKQLGQIEYQNNISLTAANANYKLLLHDKRKAIYERLIGLQEVVGAEGLSDDVAAECAKCANEAKYIFGKDVIDYFDELVDKISEFQKADRALTFAMKSLEMYVGGTQEAVDNATMIRNQTEMNVFVIMEVDVIERVIGSSLRLPDELVVTIDRQK